MWDDWKDELKDWFNDWKDDLDSNDWDNWKDW